MAAAKVSRCVAEKKCLGARRNFFLYHYMRSNCILNNEKPINKINIIMNAYSFNRFDYICGFEMQRAIYAYVYQTRMQKGRKVEQAT